MLSAGPDGVIKKVREKNEFWGQYGVPDCSSRLRDFEYVRYSGRHSREMCMSVRDADCAVAKGSSGRK